MSNDKADKPIARMALQLMLILFEMNQSDRTHITVKCGFSSKLARRFLHNLHFACKHYHAKNTWRNPTAAVSKGLTAPANENKTRKKRKKRRKTEKGRKERKKRKTMKIKKKCTNVGEAGQANEKKSAQCSRVMARMES